MALQKQEFYEGAAFHVLASTGRIVGIIADPPFFILNGRLLILLKYTTKGRSPWGFTFTSSERHRLDTKARKFPKVRIGLICGSDGVATITYEEYLQIASTASAAHIACYRDHGEYYQISGPDGTLKRKVAPSSWQRIFD